MRKQPAYSADSCGHRQAGTWRIGALFAAVFGLAILLTGCAQHGPDLVKAGRNDYNRVLVQTDDEEQLLNLVRLRYSDSLMMLQVSSVSTSFTWSQSATAEAFKFEPSSDRSNVGVRGNLGYSERPTVTYTPLGGKDFVENLLTPVELNSLLLLSRSGWSIDRLLRVIVDRVNGLPNAQEASGPTPLRAPKYKDFIRVAKLLRTLQERDAMTGGYRHMDDKQVPAGRVTVTRDGDGQPFDWSRVTGDLLVIKSQAERPANAAVAVPYRGSWFYIDDSDMNSKNTFMLLGALTALQSGSIERSGPLLTLPVTGQ